VRYNLINSDTKALTRRVGMIGSESEQVMVEDLYGYDTEEHL